MLTRKDIPHLLTAGLKTIFFNAYKSVTPIYTQLTTEVTSNNSSEEYGWLGATPELRKWIDERAPKGIKENGFVLKNEDFEASIEVDRNAIDDDQYGHIKTRISQMGIQAGKGYDKHLASVIEENGLCYDGQNFFDTDHPQEDGTTQANLFTSKALTAANAETVLTAMKNLKDETGMLKGINPTHIVVPANLEFTAKKLFDPTVVAVTTDPAAAVLKGALKVVVLPYLTSATTWYVIDLSQGVSPFIYQNRKSLEFVAMDNADDIENFMRKKLYYGVDARFAFGLGDWMTAAKCTA